jgi:hypothetical protein
VFESDGKECGEQRTGRQRIVVGLCVFDLKQKRKESTQKEKRTYLFILFLPQETWAIMVALGCEGRVIRMP